MLVVRQRQKVFHDGWRDELCDLPSRLVHHGRRDGWKDAAGLFAVSGGVQLRWLEHKDPVSRRNGGLRGRLVMHAMRKREPLQPCRVEYLRNVRHGVLHDGCDHFPLRFSFLQAVPRRLRVRWHQHLLGRRGGRQVRGREVQHVVSGRRRVHCVWGGQQVVDGRDKSVHDLRLGVENDRWNNHEPHGLRGVSRRLHVRWRIYILQVPRGNLLCRWGCVVQRLRWRFALRRRARVYRLQDLCVDLVHLGRVGRPPRQVPCVPRGQLVRRQQQPKPVCRGNGE